MYDDFNQVVTLDSEQDDMNLVAGCLGYSTVQEDG